MLHENKARLAAILTVKKPWEWEIPQGPVFHKQMRRVFEKALEPYACRECGGWHIGGNEFSKHTVRPVRRCVQIMAGGLEA